VAWKSQIITIARGDNKGNVFGPTPHKTDVSKTFWVHRNAQIIAFVVIECSNLHPDVKVTGHALLTLLACTLF
jgi:hypothetical protein